MIRNGKCHAGSILETVQEAKGEKKRERDEILAFSRGVESSQTLSQKKTYAGFIAVQGAYKEQQGLF